MEQDRARRAQGYATGSTRLVVVVGVLAAALVVASGGAFGLGATLTLKVPLGTVPVIDGKIEPAEWADAARLPIPFAGHPASLLVKHDDKTMSLDILLTVQDDRPQGGIVCCSVSIYFDDQPPLGSRDSGEDEMGFGPEDQASDQYFRNAPSPGYYDDRMTGGTFDTVSAGSYDSAGKILVLEASKPLCSGDSRDICLKDGSIVGFTLDYYTSAETAVDYPVGPDDFAGFAHLQLSAKSLSADLAVQVRPDKNKVNAGEPVKFTVDVTNNGPDTADNGIVDIPVAALSPGIAATATPAKACGCAFASLAPGEHMTFPPRTIVPTA